MARHRAKFSGSSYNGWSIEIAAGVKDLGALGLAPFGGRGGFDPL